MMMLDNIEGVDGRKLPFGAGSFDCCATETTLTPMLLNSLPSLYGLLVRVGSTVWLNELAKQFLINWIRFWHLVGRSLSAKAFAQQVLVTSETCINFRFIFLSLVQWYKFAGLYLVYVPLGASWTSKLNTIQFSMCHCDM